MHEWKEETGYVATLPKGAKAAEGLVMGNDSGCCNTNTKMNFVEVDMADPEDQNPQSELQQNEYIETFTIPLSNLWNKLEKLDQQGFAVDARVGTFA